MSSVLQAWNPGAHFEHDQVLKSLAGVERARHLKTSQRSINFVKAREQPKTSAARTSAGILASARDWQLQVDMERQLKVPTQVLTTTLRPDIVLHYL